MKPKKSILFLLSLSFFLLSGWHPAATSQAHVKSRFEAEQALIPKGSNVVIKSESGTSGEHEQYVSLAREVGQQRNSILVFNKALKVTKPGNYKIVIGYKTVEGHYKKQFVKVIEPQDDYQVDTENKQLKNEVKIFETAVEFQSGVWTEKEVIIPIDQTGIFDIEIQGSWAFMDIDYLDVYSEAVIVNPEVDLLKYTFYQKAPEDLTFKYEDHYNQLQRILLNGQVVPREGNYQVNQATKEITLAQSFFLNSRMSAGEITLDFNHGQDPSFQYRIEEEPAQRVLYEAEEATILGGSKIITDATAQAKYIKIENRGGVRFDVKVPESGRYELYFRYRSPYSHKVQNIIVKNQQGEWKYGLGFPMTFQEKGVSGTDIGRWEEIKLIVELEEGYNIISLEKQQGWIDLDYLQIGPTYNHGVHPVYELATISPTQDIFYRNQPRDLYIHLEKNGNQLSGIVTEDGVGLEYTVEDYQANELDSGYALNKRTIIVAQAAVSRLQPGLHPVRIEFDNGNYLVYQLEVKEEEQTAELKIIPFYVDHGNASLIQLPNGKNLLLDSGKPEETEKMVFPFLKAQNLAVDYYIVTHYHDDHTGYRDDIIRTNQLQQIAGTETDGVVKAAQEERYRRLSQVQFLDNRLVLPLDQIERFWDLGGVKMTVLNSRYDLAGQLIADQCENNTSIAFMLEYKGFKYSHGADIYQKSQVRIMELVEPGFLRADYFFGNHHFHGSLDVDFIRMTDPKLVFVPANAAVFARGAYTTHYQLHVEDYLKANGGRLSDTIVGCESGSVIIRVNGQDDWTYEIYQKGEDLNAARL